MDLWVTTRETTDDPWAEAVNLGPTVNSSTWEYGATISADGSTLYFDSHRPGGFGPDDIWQVDKVPLVDTDGDGTFDLDDLCKLAEAEPKSSR